MLPLDAFDPKHQRPDPEAQQQHIAHHRCAGDEEARREQSHQRGQHRLPAKMFRQPTRS